MFDIHQKRIGIFARKSPDNMAQVYRFVIMTIQTKLAFVERDMENYKLLGTSAPMIWGFKVEAMEWLEANKQELFDNLTSIYEAHPNPDHAENELLLYAASLPGLGIVKGGFLIQLCFGLSGCIDSHNLARFNINPNTFKASRFKKASVGLKAKIIQAYHAQVKALGGTAMLWDSWCDYVASNQPNTYENGFHVSAIHCDTIGV